MVEHTVLNGLLEVGSRNFFEIDSHLARIRQLECFHKGDIRIQLAIALHQSLNFSFKCRCIKPRFDLDFLEQPSRFLPSEKALLRSSGPAASTR